MNHLFSTEGPLMRALSDLTTLVVLNLLTLLCSIPVVTAGAALCALNYCTMKMTEGEGHPAATFWKEFKGNLKGATPVWLVFLAVAGGSWLYTYLFPIPEDDVFFVMRVPVYLIAILFGMLFVWIFPLMARLENSFFAKFKNAAILAVLHLPRTIVMVFIYGVIGFLFREDLRLVPIAVVLGISLPAYLSTLLYVPVIKELIQRLTQQKDNGKENEEEN